MLVCWTASHINNEERLISLKKLVENIKTFPEITDHYISVSTSVEKDLSQMSKTILHQSSRKTQFEHFYAIYTSFEFEDECKIIFMDDDDLILTLPEEWKIMSCFEGHQVSQDGVILKDFSGSMCTYKQVDMYFKRRAWARVNPIEDIFFNKIINPSLISTKNPFVLRYIRPCRTEGTWGENALYNVHIRDLDNGVIKGEVRDLYEHTSTYIFFKTMYFFMNVYEDSLNIFHYYMNEQCSITFSYDTMYIKNIYDGMKEKKSQTVVIIPKGILFFELEIKLI